MPSGTPLQNQNRIQHQSGRVEQAFQPAADFETNDKYNALRAAKFQEASSGSIILLKGNGIKNSGFKSNRFVVYRSS